MTTVNPRLNSSTSSANSGVADRPTTSKEGQAPSKGIRPRDPPSDRAAIFERHPTTRLDNAKSESLDAAFRAVVNMDLRRSGRSAGKTVVQKELAGLTGDAALEGALDIANDSSRPPAVRAEAFAYAGLLAAGSNRTQAELFLLAAERLVPKADANVPGARLLHAKVLLAQGRRADGVKLLAEELKARKASGQPIAGIYRVLANAHRRLSNRAEALKHVEAAIAAGTKEGLGTAWLAGRQVDKAWILNDLSGYDIGAGKSKLGLQRRKQAIALLRKVLGDPKVKGLPKDERDTLLYRAHHAIAEQVAPVFTGGTSAGPKDRVGKHSAAINAKFTEANKSYKEAQQAPDEATRQAKLQKVRDLADQILALDPDDGLAHQMWSIVHAEMLNNTKLIAPLDTPGERKALIDELVSVADKAKVGTPPAAGQGNKALRQLFPEWDNLTEVQKATVAHQVLGYGDYIPRVIEMGGVYHLVDVGTSLSFVDPASAPGDKGPWGRHDYAGRGWARGIFVVTGIEDVVDAGRGGYGTVTHEFAHLVHEVMERASNKPAASRTAEEKRMAQQYKEIGDLFKEAKGRKNGQRLLDAYSGRSVYEHFAQAVMQQLDGSGDHGSRSLFSRNPKMWHFTRKFVDDHRDFPATATDASGAKQPYVSGTSHAPVGLDSQASPMNLAAYAKGAPAERKTVAEATLQHWQAVYNPPHGSFVPEIGPGPTGKTGTHPLASELDAAVKKRDWTEATRVAARIAASLEKANPPDAQLRALGESLERAFDEMPKSAPQRDALLGAIAKSPAAVLSRPSSEARTIVAGLGQHQQTFFANVGERLARDGGVALSNFRAHHGDKALANRLRFELDTRLHGLPGANKGLGWILRSVREADKKGLTLAPDPQPELGGFNNVARERRSELIEKWAGNQLDKSVKVREDPGAIATMGCDEMLALASADLAQLTALKPAQPQLKKRLQQLQADLRTAKESFFGKAPRRSPGDYPKVVTDLRQHMESVHKDLRAALKGP